LDPKCTGIEAVFGSIAEKPSRLQENRLKKAVAYTTHIEQDYINDLKDNSVSYDNEKNMVMNPPDRKTDYVFDTVKTVKDWQAEKQGKKVTSVGESEKIKARVKGRRSKKNTKS
jgi:hypothetical protein